MVSEVDSPLDAPQPLALPTADRACRPCSAAFYAFDPMNEFFAGLRAHTRRWMRDFTSRHDERRCRHRVVKSRDDSATTRRVRPFRTSCVRQHQLLPQLSDRKLPAVFIEGHCGRGRDVVGIG